MLRIFEITGPANGMVVARHRGKESEKEAANRAFGWAWLAHAEVVKEAVRHIYLTTSKQESTLHGFSPHLAGSFKLCQQ